MTHKQQTVTKAFVVNGNGEILVLRSSVWPERPTRSQKPDLPGGEVEANETPEAGVARETMEETGIDLPAEAFSLVHVTEKFIEKYQTIFVKKIYALKLETAEITLSWEHEAFEWMPIGKFRTIAWREFYAEEFEHVLSSGVLADFGVH